MRIFESPNEVQSTTAAQTHLKGFEDPLRGFYLPPADTTHHCFLSQLVKIPPLQPNNETPFSLVVKFDLGDGYCRTRGLPAVVTTSRLQTRRRDKAALGGLIALLSNRRQVLQTINQESIIRGKGHFSKLVQS